MKVLHICNDYRDNNLYSAMFKEMSKKISQSVYVASYQIIESMNNQKYEVKYSKCFNKTDRFFFKYKTQKIVNDIEKKFNIKSFDLIHAHTLFSNGFIAYQLKQKYNIEYTVSVRNTDLIAFFQTRPYLKKVGINILLNAKSIIYISPSIKKKVSEIIDKRNIDELSDRSYTISNGISNFWLDNIGKPLKSIPNEINLLQIGWICKNKNQIISVKALRRLIDLGYNCCLVLCGGILEESYYIRLKKEITKYGLEDKVLFKGIVDHKNLLLEYKKANILLLPSFKETFGLVAIEASTQGVPTIYSKNQGIDGIYTEGYIGYSINPNSLKDLVEAIINTQQNLEKISNNTLKIYGDYSWSKIVNKIYLDCYC